MANKYTVSNIGDSFIAKLKESYSNIVSINDWTVVSGVSNLNTIGKLSLISGSKTVIGIGTNLNLSSNSVFIIGNIEFTVDQIITPNEFTITEPSPVTGIFNFYLNTDSNNYFTQQYRWSQSTSLDGGQFSEFRELNKLTNSTDLLGRSFDTSLPLWLDIRLEAERISTGSSISLISITFELETIDGIIESCPIWCDDCTDPFAMDGCANIIIDCADGMYNPYALKKPSAIYRQLSGLANEMWGHEVKYFRVEPDQRTKDVILMEYSLYNVVEEGMLKVLVPDNAFPTREFSFDIFGMDFEEFEIHVTGEAFTNLFGLNKQPRTRDYLYFPLINRMYEISSVSLADEFNLSTTYWRVQLRKFENRTSSIHNDVLIEQEVDSLITGIDEVFGEEIQQEFEKVTKPQQYQTVYHELEDDVRYSKHGSLEIQDAEIRNRWTVISKNNYLLNNISSGERFALTYNRRSILTSVGNLAITAWIKPLFKENDNEEYVIIDGRSEADLNVGLAISISKTQLKVTINGNNSVNNLPSTLENNVWYGIVVNVNNLIEGSDLHGTSGTPWRTELGAYMYRLDPDSNKTLPHQKTGTFALFTSHVDTFAEKATWDAGKGWSLSASPTNMTNIRVFSKVIEQEQHMNVLQQYVVRDAELSLLTDNAIPSIRLRQYSNPR